MIPPITSLQNPRIKQALKLRDRKGRTAQGRIIIDGAREIARAIRGGVALDEVFICEDLCHTVEAQALLATLSSASAQQFHLTPEVFAKLAYGEREEGIIATAATPEWTLDELVLPATPLIAVLEHVEKPGNVGAVLRTADAAGVSALIVADGGTDLYNPNAIRASLGAIFTVPVCAAGTLRTLEWLREKSLPIYAARVDGATLYSDCNFSQAAAIVLGSESDGLSDAWRGDDIHAVALPMLGVVDSLNVSATAAVLFYEAWRQRQSK
jgi:RNA methyltransferase, TrmH family